MSKLFIYLTSPDHEALDKSMAILSDVLTDKEAEHNGFVLTVRPATIEATGRVMGRRVELVKPSSKLISTLSLLDFTKNVSVRISEVKN